MTVLDDLNKGLEDLHKADLPNYAQRLGNLEVKLKDLEQRLAPLLALMRGSGR